MKSKNKVSSLTRWSSKILILGLGMLCLMLSLVYQSRAGYFRLALNNGFSVMVIFILGTLNAFNLYEYVHACTDKKNDFGILNVVEFLSYILLGCGFFNVILIPVSGFGFLETALVFVYLIGNTFFIGMKTKRIQFSGTNPWRIVFLGFVLLLVKCFIFYFFDANIYLQFVEGNTGLRFLIFMFSIIAGYGLLRNLMRISEANIGLTGEKKQRMKNKAKSFIIKAWNGLVSIVKKTAMFIMSFFTGWVGFLILAIIGLLVFGIGIFFVNRFFNSVMSLVEPILQKFFTTGEYSVNNGILYFVFQILSLAIYVLVIFYLQNICDMGLKNHCNDLLENFVLNEKQFQSFNRDELKEKALKEIYCEKNDLKRIALCSEKNEIEKIVKKVSEE